MKMKKFVALLLATLMVFSLFAVNTAVLAEEPAYDAEVLGADGEKVTDLNLSDLCGCDMILLSRSVLPVLAACGVCFVLTLAAVLTVTQRRLTVPPIRLYTGSGK